LEDIILVNDQDEVTGAATKMEAHEKGLLHRAYSVFIFNPKGEMLLQQRSLNKYHSAGLWTNACCSHPAPGENILFSAEKRLFIEMGFTTPLAEAFSFTYRIEFENGLVENEIDHVFTGTYLGDITPDPAEVCDYCYMSMNDIRNSIEVFPKKYTSWFKIAFPKLEDYLRKKLLLA
jgi:isopentenyl-diphosphate Delta-isomerase